LESLIVGDKTLTFSILKNVKAMYKNDIIYPEVYK